jgi:hypothetical protein
MRCSTPSSGCDREESISTQEEADSSMIPHLAWHHILYVQSQLRDHIASVLSARHVLLVHDAITLEHPFVEAPIREEEYTVARFPALDPPATAKQMRQHTRGAR